MFFPGIIFSATMYGETKVCVIVYKEAPTRRVADYNNDKPYMVLAVVFFKLYTPLY